MWCRAPTARRSAPPRTRRQTWPSPMPGRSKRICRWATRTTMRCRFPSCAAGPQPVVQRHLCLRQAIDDTSTLGGGVVQMVNDIEAERGLSNYDVRHRVTASYQLQSPVGPDRTSWRWSILRGWQLNSNITATSGSSFTATVAAIPPALASPAGARRSDGPAGHQWLRLLQPGRVHRPRHRYLWRCRTQHHSRHSAVQHECLLHPDLPVQGKASAEFRCQLQQSAEPRERQWYRHSNRLFHGRPAAERRRHAYADSPNEVYILMKRLLMHRF